MTTSADCQQCGACCAAFRVSFYWSEAATRGLPDAMTEKVNDFYACMAGTGSAVPHCTALHGVVGERVTCTVYALRPAPCREVEPGDDKCNRARARHGLPKLTIEKADNSLKPLVGAHFSHFSLCNSSALFGCNPLPVDYTC